MKRFVVQNVRIDLTVPFSLKSHKVMPSAKVTKDPDFVGGNRNAVVDFDSYRAKELLNNEDRASQERLIMKDLDDRFETMILDLDNSEVNANRSKVVLVRVADPGDGMRTLRVSEILHQRFD